MSSPSDFSSTTRERNVFLQALEISDPARRASFLDSECGVEIDLRRHVEELLQEQAHLGNFLEEPALSNTSLHPLGTLGPEGTVVLPAGGEKPGDRIGRYRLLQQIGEGGCGVVYMADQEEPVRRRVAVKVIKLGMDSRNVIARFEAERQALAMMDHPNIAQVLDAGATDAGRPFFVMELVRGVRITEYCDQNRVTAIERIRLFIQVCQAVQHAHQKGIIHRDLKPSNILVTLHDGMPVPKVIDFGIAKATEQRLTDKTLFTAFTAFIGTPAYMSPEQAEMSGLDVDTRSDVYSLGVLLYELLTGRTPFDPEELLKGGYDACRRTLREEEPTRPSTLLSTLQNEELNTTASHLHTEAPKLIHLLKGDLDWIIMKCLEKDRTRRYATATALADDLQNYLDDEPVIARPPSNLYRFQKLLHRHQLAVTASAVVVLTLFLAALVSTWLAVRATRAEAVARDSQKQEARLRREAELESAAARLNEYIADINLAHQSLAAGNYGRASSLIERHRPQPGNPDLRGFEWRYLWRLCRGNEHVSFPNQGSPILCLAFSPDGSEFAVGLRDSLLIYQVKTQSLVARIPKSAQSAVYTVDGQSLITASRNTVRVWRTRDWTEQATFQDESEPVTLSHQGHLLASQTREGVLLRDTDSWKPVRTLRNASGPMAFSPQDNLLATDSRKGITLWPLSPDGLEVILGDSTNLFHRGGPWFRQNHGIVFSPDGKTVVAARNTPSTRGAFILSTWNASSGKELGFFPSDPEHPEHTSVISCLIASRKQPLLATGSWDHSIRLWDLSAQKFLGAVQGNLNEVWCIALAPDESLLVSGAKDGGLNLWPLPPRSSEEELPGEWIPLAFSADDRTLAVLSPDCKVAHYDMATREIDHQIQLPLDRPFPWFFASVSSSENLRTLAFRDGSGQVFLWDDPDRTNRVFAAAGSRNDFVTLSPDGRNLVVGARDRPLRWFQLNNSTNPPLEIEASSALFSADSRILAAFQRDSQVLIYNVSSRSLRTNILANVPFFANSTLSCDGRLLATSSGPDDPDNAIHLWSTTTSRLIGTITGHKQPVSALALSPDGQTLASSSHDGTLRFWNIPTQQELLSIRRIAESPRKLLFSSDGRVLVSAEGYHLRNPRLHFFRAPSLAETDVISAQPLQEQVMIPEKSSPRPTQTR
jgi:serine/threonine protein kinase/WD40 repeat protein